MMASMMNARRVSADVSQVQRLGKQRRERKRPRTPVPRAEKR
jgi:hypothetical protein